MGTALRFLEEARAAYIAKKLQTMGYGVLWEPEHPNIVMTSAEQPKVRAVIKENQGLINTWYHMAKICT